jgi:hypothetical protein
MTTVTNMATAQKTEKKKETYEVLALNYADKATK